MISTKEIIDRINELSIEEHGCHITIDSKLIDTGTDSFGVTMILLELNEDYGCFDNEWFKNTNIPELTIQDMIVRIQNESK